jgi:hypothetical protein
MGKIAENCDHNIDPWKEYIFTYLIKLPKIRRKKWQAQNVLPSADSVGCSLLRYIYIYIKATTLYERRDSISRPIAPTC